MGVVLLNSELNIQLRIKIFPQSSFGRILDMLLYKKNLLFVVPNLLLHQLFPGPTLSVAIVLDFIQTVWIFDP